MPRITTVQNVNMKVFCSKFSNITFDATPGIFICGIRSAGVWAEVPEWGPEMKPRLEVWEPKYPQKLKQFADIVYRY